MFAGCCARGKLGEFLGDVECEPEERDVDAGDPDPHGADDTLHLSQKMSGGGAYAQGDHARRRGSRRERVRERG